MTVTVMTQFPAGGHNDPDPATEDNRSPSQSNQCDLRLDVSVRDVGVVYRSRFLAFWAVCLMHQCTIRNSHGSIPMQVGRRTPLRLETIVGKTNRHNVESPRGYKMADLHRDSNVRGGRTRSRKPSNCHKAQYMIAETLPIPQKANHLRVNLQWRFSNTF